MMVELKARTDGWMPPVVKTVATTGAGVPALLDQLERHRQYLATSDRMAKRRRNTIRAEVVELVEARLQRSVWARPAVAEQLDGLVRKVMAGGSTPYRAAEELLKAILPGD
jgi:LAO/AO transport system kinase